MAAGATPAAARAQLSSQWPQAPLTATSTAAAPAGTWQNVGTWKLKRGFERSRQSSQAGLRLALSKLRIRAWGHAKENPLSSKKCFRCKASNYKDTADLRGEKRTPRQTADFLTFYVHIFTTLFMCMFINRKQITMCVGALQILKYHLQCRSLGFHIAVQNGGWWRERSFPLIKYFHSSF